MPLRFSLPLTPATTELGNMLNAVGEVLADSMPTGGQRMQCRYDRAVLAHFKTSR